MGSVLFLLYMVVAVGTYFAYTRKRGGRAILGAALWPLLLVSAFRQGHDTLQSTRNHWRLARSDKGVMGAPEPPPPAESSSLIELPKYGQIDPTDE